MFIFNILQKIHNISQFNYVYLIGNAMYLLTTMYIWIVGNVSYIYYIQSKCMYVQSGDRV